MSRVVAKGRLGRPRKEPKVQLNVTIRQTVNEEFRRFIGSGVILGEAIERALVNEMKRGSRAA